MPQSLNEHGGLYVGVPVAILHFFVAGFVVLSLLGAAHKLMADTSDAWIMPAFFVVMFPVSLLGFVGAFKMTPVALLLVPTNSVLWGLSVVWLVNRKAGERPERP